MGRVILDVSSSCFDSRNADVSVVSQVDVSNSGERPPRWRKKLIFSLVQGHQLKETLGAVAILVGFEADVDIR